jgi:hypothetical protein
MDKNLAVICQKELIVEVLGKGYRTILAILKGNLLPLYLRINN